MQVERLQKKLSQAGLGSRREMEDWIERGWVHVNGATATLGMSVSSEDKISVKGKPLESSHMGTSRIRILLYHKPVGEISSRRDPKHPDTVFDRLPKLKQGRWVQVGRLDLNTSGLLLFTNNGDLANRLMHPRYELEREYAVRVFGQVSPQVIKTLLNGVELEDGVAKFKRIEARGGDGSNTWYHAVLSEGRNREVRRLWQSQGVTVSRLIRIRYGEFVMPRFLSRGDHQELSRQEVDAFMARL